MKTRLVDYLKAMQEACVDTLLDAVTENEYDLSKIHYMMISQYRLLDHLIEKARNGDFGED